MKLAKRYEIDDPRIMRFTEIVTEDFEIAQGPMKWFDLFPWIVPYIPPFIKNKWMRLDYMQKTRDELNGFLKVCCLSSISKFNDYHVRLPKCAFVGNSFSKINFYN